MKEINWNDPGVPAWANAVIASNDGVGTPYFVEQWGGISQRQRVGYSEIDPDCSADMYEPHHWKLISVRPVTWNGEGLPPVGAKCLYTMQTTSRSPIWYECEVSYVVGDGSGIVALCHACGADVEQFLDAETTLFKPLSVKSKEETEKETAIQSILDDFDGMWCQGDWDLAEYLYTKVYRKQ